MPVEIRELVIRTQVDQQGQTGAPPTGSGGGNNGGNDALIKACVEKVMEILKQKNER